MQKPIGSESDLSTSSESDLGDFLLVRPHSLAPESDSLLPILDLPRSFREQIDKGSSTGWKAVDLYLQGLRKGEVTVVTADTGVGKTTFCLHLLVNCAIQGLPVWINSWEMRPEIVMRKIASIVLRRPMKLQNFTAHENEQFDEWCGRHKVYVNPNTIGTSIQKFADQLQKAKDLGIQVVLIDHLDYLVSSRHKDQRHEAIEEAVRQLHELAFHLSMHFLLICHPRQTYNNEEVGLNSLKGSSSIKQYADNVVILHRCVRTDSSSDPDKVKIRIAKNRMFGIEGTTYLFYQPAWDGYLELKDCI